MDSHPLHAIELVIFASTANLCCGIQWVKVLYFLGAFSVVYGQSASVYPRAFDQIGGLLSQKS